MQSVLQKYYTDVLGIGVVSIMVMFIIARVWDAINDPLWGRIIDRIPPAPDGRYRRWLKTLAVPVALSAVLMFVKIPGLSEGGYLAYAYVTYILFGMLYTGINIPYGSLAQVITSDDRERSSLSVFRSIGSTFGAMPAMLLISFCYVKNENGTSVMSYGKILTGAAVIAALSVAAYLLCYRWTTERVPTKPAPKEKRADVEGNKDPAAQPPRIWRCALWVCCSSPRRCSAKATTPISSPLLLQRPPACP